jgi:rSAM/selenodomain-associated transferase 2
MRQKAAESYGCSQTAFFAPKASFPLPPGPALSVVIPALNEAKGLRSVIDHTRRVAFGRGIEIVVSDCDSQDGTAEIAREAGATVVTGGRNRADALNRGAAAASCPTLLFIHADSRVPDYFVDKIESALAAGVVGGTFDFQFGSHPRNRGLTRQTLRFVAFVNRLRFRCTRIFFGDQGLFVRRDVFEQVGGFPRMPLFEDVYLSRKLKQVGKTAILSPAMKTCPRRFVDRGVLRQFASDVYLLTADMLGERPHAAWKRYNGVNRKAS